MSECTHETFGYFPAVNEAGWKCFDSDHLMPGEPDGYRPDLDRSHTEDKVYGIMNDLHEGKFIHVSNGTGGDIITSMVANKCRETGFYDQISIIRYILEAGESAHANYWKQVGDGIVSGNDPRDRCACGKLATTYQGDKKSCSECSSDLFAELKI